MVSLEEPFYHITWSHMFCFSCMDSSLLFLLANWANPITEESHSKKIKNKINHQNTWVCMLSSIYVHFLENAVNYINWHIVIMPCRSSALIKRNLRLKLINQIINNSECQVNYEFTSSMFMQLSPNVSFLKSPFTCLKAPVIHVVYNRSAHLPQHLETANKPCSRKSQTHQQTI